MNHYHAHIYFEPDELEIARLWSKRAGVLGFFKLISFREYPIGPHPTGMIEAHFSEPDYVQVIEWLKVHHGVFSVLIHQDTGDDFKDHTDGICWLGKELPLKFDFFKLIEIDPDLRIHKSLIKN